jgi:predicted metal-dependent enzyme (double-stranded beta helix superfamily)
MSDVVSRDFFEGFFVSNLNKLMQDLHEAIQPAATCKEAALGTCEVLRRYSCNSLELPERLSQVGSSCYARHLVHQEDDGYCVVAMVWGPGQGTSVHDHGGVWCVEGCIQGQLEITSYRMVEQALPDNNVRLVPEECVHVGQGSVGCLIPPFEHHKIHNPFDHTAITIHVYGQRLDNCTRFVKSNPATIADETLYHKEKVSLSYTSLPTSIAL